MAQFLSEYGLFLLEFLTVVVVIVVAIVIVISAARKSGDHDGLTVENVNRSVEQQADIVRQAILGRRDARKLTRQRAREQKRSRRKDRNDGDAKRRRLFVLDFKGDIRASATASLRQEVSAVLDVAERGDEVLLRLENSGGAVHEHGLAASQLLRLRAHGVPLTVAVDKVAASGGYLMATTADRIIAAPFAIIGSVGVLVQIPNFHRLLNEKGIDFEQLTAGKYKRTLTLFGENTDEGREKMQQELADVHELFKRQISELRPALDLDQVATGEHWYGSQALELKLIDEIGTSDDFLRQAAQHSDLYHLSYKRPKRFVERLMQGAEGLLSR